MHRLWRGSSTSHGDVDLIRRIQVGAGRARDQRVCERDLRHGRAGFIGDQQIWGREPSRAVLVKPCQAGQVGVHCQRTSKGSPLGGSPSDWKDMLCAASQASPSVSRVLAEQCRVCRHNLYRARWVAVKHSSTLPAQKGVLTACVAKPAGALSKDGKPEGKPPAYCASTACIAPSEPRRPGT